MTYANKATQRVYIREYMRKYRAKKKDEEKELVEFNTAGWSLK